MPHDGNKQLRGEMQKILHTLLHKYYTLCYKKYYILCYITYIVIDYDTKTVCMPYIYHIKFSYNMHIITFIKCLIVQVEARLHIQS